jgi:hypothetical protein
MQLRDSTKANENLGIPAFRLKVGTFEPWDIKVF